jgi:hypothetical protein
MKPLTPGEPVKLAFNLGPTSYIFKAGHRIRLTITCADPTLTPQLSPPPVVSLYRNSVSESRHRNSVWRSYLTLPIGGAQIAATVRIEPETLNPKSKGIFTAFVTFPRTLAKGYLEDLNVGSVKCNGVPALSGSLHHNTWIFKFNKEDFNGLLNSNKAKMIVEGSFGEKFNYGNLSFEGSDMVRINKK